MTDSIGTPLARQQVAVRADLEETAQQLETAKFNRVHYIRKARQLGVTFTAIGDSLGITEGAVRALLVRSEQES